MTAGENEKDELAGMTETEILSEIRRELLKLTLSAVRSKTPVKPEDKMKIDMLKSTLLTCNRLPDEESGSYYKNKEVKS